MDSPDNSINNKTVNNKNYGLLLGFIGVACFSFTMPMVKLSIQSFDPWVSSFGRAVLAGLVSFAYLAYKKKFSHIRKYWKILFGIAGGIVFGFPVLTSIAIQHTTASHAGIVLAILPIMTAIVGSVLDRKHQSLAFWCVAVVGCITVLVYILSRNNISFESADILVLFAALAASFGYYFGARLARSIPAIEVICCALVISLPITIPVTLYALVTNPPQNIVPSAVIGLLYISFISQLVGFIPWYRGLELGGVAAVSQIQLLQVFMTLTISAIMLGEVIGLAEYAIALIVVLEIYIAKKLARS